MRLYRTTAGRFAATQAEAGEGFTRCDMPDDKAQRIAWLNEQINEVGARAYLEGVAKGKRTRDMSATAQLSRVDNPGIDIDAIVEAIVSSEPYALKRFAGAVAVRFAEGAK
jgi:hypothetical protein